MATPSTTLRDLTGLGHRPASLREAALVMVDCQNTYRRGVMQLVGVEEALAEAKTLLAMARDTKTPVIHIQHDAGPGTPYDVRDEIGAITDLVAPLKGEAVIVKNYPNAFVKTELDAQLAALGVKQLVLAGFMTHMCIASTAHGAFNLGYGVTIVGNATASRALQGPHGKVLSAREVHDGALAATRDLYAAVVDRAAELSP